MEEALGANGYGFLEQHDALIGLVADELQGGEAAGRRHVEMLPAARGHDKAFCCGHVGVLPCGGMRINVGTININVHEPARPGSPQEATQTSPRNYPGSCSQPEPRRAKLIDVRSADFKFTTRCLWRVGSGV